MLWEPGRKGQRANRPRPCLLVAAQGRARRSDVSTARAGTGSDRIRDGRLIQKTGLPAACAQVHGSCAGMIGCVRALSVRGRAMALPVCGCLSACLSRGRRRRSRIAFGNDGGRAAAVGSSTPRDGMAARNERQRRVSAPTALVRLAITDATNSSTAVPCSDHSCSDWNSQKYPVCGQSRNLIDVSSCCRASPPQWIACGRMLMLQTESM